MLLIGWFIYYVRTHLGVYSQASDCSIDLLKALRRCSKWQLILWGTPTAISITLEPISLEFLGMIMIATGSYNSNGVVVVNAAIVHIFLIMQVHW